MSAINTTINSLSAFWLREMRLRFGSFRLGYIWAIIEPSYQIALFTALHTVIRGANEDLYGGSAANFMVYGVVSWLAFQHGIDRTLGALAQARGLFAYRQIKPIDVIIVRVFLEFYIFTVVLFLMLFAASWLGFEVEFANPLAAMPVVVALFVLTLGLGLAVEVGSTLQESLKRVVPLVMRPLFFISGLFFAVDMVPQQYWPYLLWNPVLHATDLIREAALSGYQSPASFYYLSVCSAVSLFLGLSLYRRYQYRLI